MSEGEKESERREIHVNKKSVSGRRRGCKIMIIGRAKPICVII